MRRVPDVDTDSDQSSSALSILTVEARRGLRNFSLGSEHPQTLKCSVMRLNFKLKA